MTRSAEKFGRLLTEAIYRVRLQESKKVKKTLGMVQDEVGYALGREGGSAIEYWRKGNIPGETADLENLGQALVERGGLDQTGLKQLLEAGGHPNPALLCEALFSPFPLAEFAPFVVGPPITHPRQFFGREQELQRIFNLLRRFPLQNAAIVGLHRSGKTSLLRYVEKITRTAPGELRPGQQADWLAHPESYRWVFVDFQNPQMCQQERLLQYLLSSLEMPRPAPCDLNGFIEVVSQHLQGPAVILMDEIGAGLAAPGLEQQFWWGLRSLGSNYAGGRLSFILTAHRLPAFLAQEYGKPSPFFNIFGHILELGPLNETAARALISSAPRPFRPADVAWILEQSRGWPALLQILGDSCLTAQEEGRTDQGWRAEALERLRPFRHLLEAGKV